MEMVTTCGFEEAKDNNPHNFSHMQRFHALQCQQRKILQCRPNTVVATFQSHGITRTDFKSLSPDTPISYGALDFTYAYLQSLADSRSSPNRIMLLDSQVSNEVIVGKNASKVALLASKSFAFLPVECPDGDWSLLVLCVPHGTAFYYNTCPNCRKGFFLINGIVERVKTSCGQDIELVELNSPQLDHRSDSGVLVCEITALLVRRLIQAKPSHRLSLGLGGTSFIVGAGRTMLQTLIMSLYVTGSRSSTIILAKGVQATDLRPPSRVSSHAYSQSKLTSEGVGAEGFSKRPAGNGANYQQNTRIGSRDSSSYSNSSLRPLSSPRALEQEKALARKRAEEAAHEVWKAARRYTIQERSKDSYSQSISRGWWPKYSQGTVFHRNMKTVDKI